MKQSILIICLLLFFYTHSQSKIDSLTNVVKTTTSDKIKGETYLELGQEYAGVNLDQDMKYFDQGVALALKKKE